MRKLKTNRSINKRFKVTSSSKVLRRMSCRNHLLEKKSSKRKRKLRKVLTTDNCDVQNVIHALPYAQLN